MQLFISLWFPYLKVELNFVERLRDLAPCVRENLKRMIEFLMNANILV